MSELSPNSGKNVQKSGGIGAVLYTWRIVILVFLFLTIASAITYILYVHTQTLLSDRLKSRLVAIVSTAAPFLQADDVEDIRTPEDKDRDSFKRLVEQLEAVRSANQNIQYAYVMRRTSDPNIFEFVADADSLGTLEELDENGNNEWDEEEVPPQPGDEYPVEDFPVLRDEAFYHPAVDRVLQEDKWALVLAAYAPIYDDNGSAIAILGIDVLVSDFMQITQAMLLPFLLFILLLTLLLLLLTILLVRFYTERVNAVRELDRQKDELLGIVSHQLATPVTALRWNLESLDDGDLGALANEQKQVIKDMQSMTADLADLVGMILDVSRIQLGRMQANKQDMNFLDLINEICLVVEPKAVSKKIQFTKTLPSEMPIASLDRRLTRMTIENLLTNAVKYTPENGVVKFDVSYANQTISIKVKDTGCGIPKADQAKIFGKLFRASNVRNSVDGNGFGLYVAKGAIESQGGNISFESEEGRGTTFIVSLPLRDKKDA